GAPGPAGPGVPGPGGPGTGAGGREVVDGPGGLRLVRGTTTFTGVTASLWDRTGCDAGCSWTAL
ncbi:MAG: hypothetical protein ACFCVG_00540, partial [Kineosporiaceae bacterium]